MFRVPVPAGFTEKDELIWTLTTHGKTEKAYATLRPDYVVDDVVKASETGALGAGTSSPEVRANKPPTVHIEEVKARTVKVGRAADARQRRQGRRHSEAARRRRWRRCRPAQARRAADPRAGALQVRNPAMAPPSRITVGKNVGLHVSWFVYRGPRRKVDLRSAAGQGLGGHARRRELAVGAALGRAEDARRRQAAGAGDVLASPAPTCSAAAPTTARSWRTRK